VLGRLAPEDFLGGGMKLDPAAAHGAVSALAARLGLDLLETAEGILTVINSNMANAIRSRTVQKGIDPRGFSLVAFGGAGPLHGAEVAAMLDIPEVVVPRYPGITSAMGLLTTDLKYDSIRTCFQVSHSIDLDKLNADLAAMESALKAQFAADRLDLDNVTFARIGDLRYVGQGYELRVPFPAGDVDTAGLEEVWRRFHEAHRMEYGRAFETSPIEIVNLRVTGVGRLPKLTQPAPPSGGALADAKVKVGACVFRVGDRLQSHDTTFYQRHLVAPGAKIASPAIILQQDSTTVIPPGMRAEVDAIGNIIIEVRAHA
jgi:N-methylhydantoinase A